MYIFQLTSGLLFYNFFLGNPELRRTLVLKADLCGLPWDQKWELVPSHHPRTEGQHKPSQETATARALSSSKGFLIMLSFICTIWKS